MDRSQTVIQRKAAAVDGFLGRALYRAVALVLGLVGAINLWIAWGRLGDGAAEGSLQPLIFGLVFSAAAIWFWRRKRDLSDVLSNMAD